MDFDIAMPSTKRRSQLTAQPLPCSDPLPLPHTLLISTIVPPRPDDSLGPSFEPPEEDLCLGSSQGSAPAVRARPRTPGAYEQGVEPPHGDSTRSSFQRHFERHEALPEVKGRRHGDVHVMPSTDSLVQLVATGIQRIIILILPPVKCRRSTTVCPPKHHFVSPFYHLRCTWLCSCRASASKNARRL